jgi:uncharacterized FlaG/YvyC family protein
MNIFGIGPLEFFLILVIALIIMGPNDMAKAGRTMGRYMRKIITSPEWRTLLQASREMRNLPNRMMREAGIEDIQKNLPTPDQLIKESGLTEAMDDVNKQLQETTKDINKELQDTAKDVNAELKEASAWSNPIVETPDEPETKPESGPDQPEKPTL